MKKGLRLSLLLCTCALTALAETTYPVADWQDQPDPVASEHAYPGGTITTFAGQYPQSFNYYLDNNSLSSQLFSSMYESLLSLDPVTTDYAPGIANRWSISDDKKTFTFYLDPAAAWSDGTPITADDVIWTFNTILDDKNLTGVHKVSLENFEKPLAVNKHTVQFRAKDVHWRNLGAVGGFQILPKHVFVDRDFNKINFEFPIVSGPYQIDEVNEGVYVTMKRRPDWWARERASNKNLYNFDVVKYRFYTDRANAFEAFKKGDIDIFPVYTSRLWVNETDGDKFTRNWIAKQRIKNRKPLGFQGFAMNMRRPPFDDIRTRKALAHLLDRKKMNSSLMYNQYFLQKSYFEDLYDAEHPCTNPVFDFDKDAARELLAEAGWAMNPERSRQRVLGQVLIPAEIILVIASLLAFLYLTKHRGVAKAAMAVIVLAPLCAGIFFAQRHYSRLGERAGILEKDGEPFLLRFLTRDPTSDKFLAIYSEDLKDVGIQLTIDRKDWAAWTKDMGEFNYDMTWAAWGAGLFKDPEGMWEASEADRLNGNNITGFKNTQVDKLIEKQKTEFDITKRNDICRQIDALIAADVPYVLLWNMDYTRLLYWNRFGTPDSVLSRYGTESDALAYWWFDEDSAADLEDAMANDAVLPKKPPEVLFE